ncbi:MAG: hypothetical protein ABGZ24_24135, partial [Fuerstiella sp.]
MAVGTVSVRFRLPLSGTEIFRFLANIRGLWRDHAQLHFKLPQGIFGHGGFGSRFTFDFFYTLFREVRSNPCFRAVRIDLVLQDRFDLTKIGRDTEFEGSSQFRQF